MAQEKIPAALVAKVMGLTPSEYYPVPEEERGNVKVSF